MSGTPRFEVGDAVRYVRDPEDRWAKHWDVRPNKIYTVIEVHKAMGRDTYRIKTSKGECSPLPTELAAAVPTNKQQLERRKECIG